MGTSLTSKFFIIPPIVLFDCNAYGSSGSPATYACLCKGIRSYRTEELNACRLTVVAVRCGFDNEGSWDSFYKIGGYKPQGQVTGMNWYSPILGDMINWLLCVEDVLCGESWRVF